MILVKEHEKPVREKVVIVYNEFVAKWGFEPTHIAMTEEDLVECNAETYKGIKLVSRPYVLKHHFNLWKEKNE